MNIPDPVTTGLTVAALQQLAKQTQDFIGAISGHPGESLGTFLGNIGRRRLNNAEGTVERAHFTLLNIGVKPKDIPLKIVLPLLEGASLEEDPRLQEKWANLLANAADPRQRDNISTIFQSVLRDLSPMDAAFLDAIHAAWMGKATRWLYGSFSEQELKVVFTRAGLARVGWAEGSQYRSDPEIDPNADNELSRDLDDFNTSLEILLRAGLLRPITETEALHVTDFHSEVAPAAGSTIPVYTSTYFNYSSFGQRFVKACQPPPHN
jgi:Abortive infection alpha